MARNKERLIPEVLPIRNGEGEMHVFRSVEDTDRLIEVATGFTAIPELYYELAETIALGGWANVVIPDLNSPLSWEEETDNSLAYRAERLRLVAEEVGKHTQINAVDLLGHSYGGATAAEATVDFPYPIEVLHLICSVGFGGVVIEDAARFRGQAVQAYTNEILGITRHAHLRRYLGFNALKKELGVMRAAKHRISDLRGIVSVTPERMVELINALKARVVVDAQVAPRDHFVHPGPTIELLGRDNVVDIHPKANHLAPCTYGGHVARLAMAA